MVCVTIHVCKERIEFNTVSNLSNLPETGYRLGSSSSYYVTGRNFEHLCMYTTWRPQRDDCGRKLMQKISFKFVCIMTLYVRTRNTRLKSFFFKLYLYDMYNAAWYRCVRKLKFCLYHDPWGQNKKQQPVVCVFNRFLKKS